MISKTQYTTSYDKQWFFSKNCSKIKLKKVFSRHKIKISFMYNAFLTTTLTTLKMTFFDSHFCVK